MTYPVSHWQMVTADPDGIAEFYGKVFGWEISTSNGLGYREVRTRPGEHPDGGIWPSDPGRPEMVQLFIEVDDIDRVLAEVEARGGRTFFPRQVLPDGDAMAVAIDPAGRPFGLMTRKPA